MKRNNYAIRWAIGLTLLMLCQSVMALTVTRGPYLQSGTQTSAIVKWSTDDSVNSHVSYGTSPGNLDQSVTISGNRSLHEVKITGLAPGSKYYYSVGSSTQALVGGDNNHYFKTTLPKDSQQPIRIWAIGDSGTANSSARAVRDAYLNFNGAGETDLMIMLGDNAYNDGTDSEYQAAVFNTYPSLLRNTMLWSTLGNHDGHSADSASQSGPYYNIFTFPRNAESGGLASGTEAYFSFDYGDIHFINLDSYETNRSSSGAMMNWLEADLSTTDKKWVIAFFHHPPYSKGSHNSDSESNLIDMRQNALPILESYGVDLVLSGHSHSYERSYLIDGHYGNSGSFNNSHKVDGGDGREQGNGAYEKATAGAASFHEGAVYIVAGSSGKTSGGSLNHPAMYYSLNSLGSMVLDIDGNRLDAKFLNSNGNNPSVLDSFTILKGPSGPQPPDQPVIDPAGGVFANSTVVSLSTTTEGASIYYTLNGTDPSASSTPYNQPFTVNETTTVKAIAVHDELGDSAIASNQITIIPAGSTLLQDSGTDGVLSIEAEHHDANVAQGGHAWEENSPAGFSGTAAMIANPNNGTNNDTGFVSNSPMMEYQVTFVKTGTHYIWVRGLGSSTSDNSVHVGLDGQAISTSDRIELTSSLDWTEDTRDGAVATVEVDFPGLHTVNVWMREDGSVIDKIVFTSNANFSVSGQGPAESPRGSPPVADAGTAYDGVVGVPVVFDGSGSTDADGNSLSYSWDFGDGSSGIGVNPSHTYSAVGSYSVTLIVNDGFQDSDSDSSTVTITSGNQTPVANPGGPYSGEVASTVFFDGSLSSDADGDTLSYSWDFGDGSNGSGVAPNHTYANAGNYTVQLTVNDSLVNSIPVSTTATIVMPNRAPTALDDDFTVNEDVELNANVLSNDTDPDDDSLSVQDHSQPSNGNLVLSSNGSFSYSPDNNFHGEDAFSYTITDGNGETASATVVITINPVNDAPTISSNAVTVAQQGVQYSYEVQASDEDNGDVLTYALTTAPNGMTINSATGLIQWLPTNTDVGNNSITVQVTDSSNAPATQSYTLVVSNSNDAPTISGTPPTTLAEDTAFNFIPEASDTDVGDILTFSISNKPAWAEFSEDTGALTGTPGNDDTGIYTGIVISVTDGIATTSLPAFTLTVTNVNDAPVAENDSVTLDEDSAETISVLVNDNDIDGDELSITNKTNGSRGTVIINPDNTLTYQTDENATGSDNFSYTISDGNGGTSTAVVAVTITAVNDTPTIESTALLAAQQGTTYSYDVQASDVDNGDNLTYTLTVSPNGMTINSATGLIQWTPANADVGSHDVTVRVTDSANAVATQSYTLAVSNTNDAPTISGSPSTTVAEDSAYSFIPDASDVDAGDTLLFSISNKPSWAEFSETSGALSGTPTNAHVGIYEDIIISVTDGIATDSLATFNLTVTNRNDAPIAVGDSHSVNEDDIATILVLANDADADGDSLSIVSVSEPEHGVTSITETDGIRYEPDQNYNGMDTFLYTISDGRGGSASAAVMVTVVAINDAPEIDSSPISDAVEGERYQYAVNATDVDGDTLSFKLDTAPGEMTIDSETGLIEWLPGAADVGDHDVTAIVTDSTDATATQSFSLTVENSEVILIASNDEVTTDLNTAVNIAVLSNDTYANADTLTVSLKTQASLGSVVVNSDRTLSYEPNTDAYGDDSFEYTITDVTGVTSSAAVTVTIDDGGLSATSPLLLFLAAVFGYRRLGRRPGLMSK